MADILDYLKWRGDLTFAQAPMNPVDGLVFCALSYIHFAGIREPATLEQAAEAFFGQEEEERRFRTKNDLELLALAAKTRRFGAARLTHYRDRLIPREDTQFAAVTFLVDDGSGVIAFRGTDSTITGWKEDFNMSFQQTVPAQRMALDYTREVMQEFPIPFHLVGHSKGGNMAVFAAARSNPMLRERILDVYNNDGPGFSEYLMGDPGYLAMVPKIHSFVPQSSIIGMLMDHEEPYTIIKSKQLGLLQHDLYNWEVMGPGLITMEEITVDSRFLNMTIRNWAAGLSNQERNEIVDAVFGLIGAGEADHTQDILQVKNLLAYRKTLGENENVRKLLTGEFASLLEAAKKTYDQFSEEREKQEKQEKQRRLDPGFFRRK